MASGYRIGQHKSDYKGIVFIFRKMGKAEAALSSLWTRGFLLHWVMMPMEAHVNGFESQNHIQIFLRACLN